MIDSAIWERIRELLLRNSGRSRDEGKATRDEAQLDARDEVDGLSELEALGW